MPEVRVQSPVSALLKDKRKKAKVRKQSQKAETESNRNHWSIYLLFFLPFAFFLLPSNSRLGCSSMVERAVVNRQVAGSSPAASAGNGRASQLAMAPVSKTGDPKGLVGSTPTLSAGAEVKRKKSKGKRKRRDGGH
jgi:hypothetical protein